MNERGITTIFDAGISIENEDCYMAYQELVEAGELTIRIRGSWRVGPELGTIEEINEYIDKAIELSKKFTTDYFQMNAFKIAADQVLEEGTAYMDTEYAEEFGGGYGPKVWEDEDLLAEVFTKIDKEGFQIHVHQIGNAAATYTLDALEKARAANGNTETRHSFAHVQFLSKENMERMQKLNMNAIIAPYWAVRDDYYYDIYIPYVGKEVADTMYPENSLVEAGINTATTVKEGEYLIGPLAPYDEAMELEDIVKASTYNGAYANFMEEEVGSLEVGKKADIIILDRNIFEVDIEKVADLAIATTIFDGKVVYEAGAEE